ncbi:MAG: lamin tail domain-containing protein [Desulfitobacteriaceae bacterium]
MKRSIRSVLSVLAIALLLFSSIPLSAQGASSDLTAGQVLVNEVLPAPSSGNEWIELYNTTGSDLDISGYYIDDLANGGGSPYQIPAGSIIPAHGFWIHDFSGYFNNGGDNARFLAKDGTTILDDYSFGSTGYDVSWYRLGDGGTWQSASTSTPTKGMTNGTTNLTAGQVLVNEVLLAPSSGNEWIELYNTTGSDLDISGYYIDDLVNGGGSPYQIPAGSIIPAYGFWTHDFSGYFNNGGDNARFLAKDGTTILDDYSFGSTGYDVSWYRLGDGASWQATPTSTPTKGATNGSAGTPGGTLQIHHINIGQGDSTLVISPTGKSLLIDAGESYWNSSADAETVGPYIQSVLGSKNLDYVATTHFHLDHIGYVGYGGLWNLVEQQGFTVGKMIHRDYNNYLGTTSGTFDNWKVYLEGDGKTKLHPVVAVEGNSQIDLGGGVVVNIIVADGNGAMKKGDFSADSNPPSENDYSIGAKIRYGKFDEWVGGDLSGQYYKSSYGYAYHDIELSAAREIGDVDIYRVNHHGSDHSSSPTFVNQLDPEVSIISVGDANTYGHPRQSVMDSLLATSDVYMTERGDTTTNIGNATVAGDIVVKTDGVTYTVNGHNYTALDTNRSDADGDGYFYEVDPDDTSSSIKPQPNGGYDPVYQP